MEYLSNVDGPGCPGQQQTAGLEVDPSQRRSRGTDMGFACSDASTQTLGGAVDPSSFHHGEKGTTAAPQHDAYHHHLAQFHPRHDSIDSVASSMFSFRSKGRTETGFSSIATSILESGEPENSKEDPDDLPGFDDPSAPANVSPFPAPKNFLPRSQTFQSPTPSRSGSLIQDPEGIALALGYSPGVNLVTLPRSSSPTLASRAPAMPKEKPIPKHIRFEPTLSRRSSLPMRSLAEQHAAPFSALRRGSEQALPPAETPSLPAAQGFGLRRAAPRPSRLVMDWDSGSSPGDPLTPVPEAPVPEGEAEMTEAGASADVRDTDTAMTGQSGDGSSEADTAPGTPPSADDNTPGESPKDSDSGSVRHLALDRRAAEDICDLILERTHGMQLRDLVVMQDEAWAAANYCVDALTHVVDANAALPGQTSIPIRQRGPGANGSSHSHWGAGTGGGGGGFDAFGGGLGGGFHGDPGGQLPAGPPNGNGNGLEGSGAGGQGNGGTPGGSKRKSVDDNTSKQMFCCPFRKRNPVKFNVRDYLTCATQSFPDISQVKRHVKTFHRRNSGIKFRCPRCKKSYDSNDTLDAHLLVPPDEMCEVRDKPDEELDGDPEAGISAGTVEILNERKQNTKIDTWNALWKRLFPLDANPKDSDFIPPVELDEVREDFDRSWDDLKAGLQSELGAVLPQVLDSVSARCQQHIRAVLELSQERALEGRRSHKRRRQGSKPSMTGPGEPGPADGLGHPYAPLAGGSSNVSNVSSSPVDPAEPPETTDPMWNQVQVPMPMGPVSSQNYGPLPMPPSQRSFVTAAGPAAPFPGGYSIRGRDASSRGHSPEQLDSAKALDPLPVGTSVDSFFAPPGTAEFNAYHLELTGQYNGVDGYNAYPHFTDMPFGNVPGAG